MAPRKIALLLISLGAGPVVAFAAAAAAWFIWFHHMFIVGYQWRPAQFILALPFLLILLGLVFLYRSKR